MTRAGGVACGAVVAGLLLACAGGGASRGAVRAEVANGAQAPDGAPPPATVASTPSSPRQRWAEDPPAAPGAIPLQGFRLAGPERPPAGAPLRFDLDALPAADWGEPVRGAGFTLQRTRDGWTLWVSTTLFAEFVVATATPGRPEGAAPVSFTAFTGGRNFGQGVVPACGADSLGTRLAFWAGFAPAGWTDAGIDVEMEDGDFDLATCTGKPRRSVRGRAAAIVPGYVYGLRVREDDDHGGTRESLVVFLPRGALVSTTVDPTMPLNASNTGPFTRLTFPIERGTARSASVRISPAALSFWARLRRTTGPVLLSFEDRSAPHDDLLLGLDVAWQGDARLGTLSLAPPPDLRPYAKLLAAAAKREPPG